eukprot:7296610-Prymnesium_polylepis.1
MRRPPCGRGPCACASTRNRPSPCALRCALGLGLAWHTRDRRACVRIVTLYSVVNPEDHHTLCVGGCPIWDLLSVPARYDAEFRGRFLGPRAGISPCPLRGSRPT